MIGGELPQLPASERLADIWQELGFARDSINGAVPFEWREVQAYNELNRADLAPCEAVCLVDMSRAYCAEIADKNPLRIAPMERNA